MRTQQCVFPAGFTGGGAGDLYFADAAYFQRCTRLFVLHTQSGAGTQTFYLYKQILQVNMWNLKAGIEIMGPGVCWFLVSRLKSPCGEQKK